MSAQVRPEQVRLDVAARTAARHGQAPTWDAGTGSLLWVDAPAKAVHRLVAGGRNHTLEVPQHVSAAKPRSHGGLVLHLAEGIALFEADGKQRTWLTYWARDGVHGGATATDTSGRLWACTVRHDEGGDGWLVRLAGDGAIRLARDDVAAGTGLAFDPQDTHLYLADSPARRIDVFDFDAPSGEVRHRRPLCESVGGEPAGLCVDTAGCLWVAMRDRAELHRYTPDGELDRSVPLPVRQPTGCCFGGSDLTDLYVTSRREGVEGEGPGELDGALLVLPELGEGMRTPAFAG